MHFNGTPYIRNGRTYMQIENLSGSLLPKQIHYHFDNLSNGNGTLLNDNTNDFLNENSLEIFMEIRSTLMNALKPSIEKILNNVFSKFPYEEFFIREFLK